MYEFTVTVRDSSSFQTVQWDVNVFTADDDRDQAFAAATRKVRRLFPKATPYLAVCKGCTGNLV